jgi:UDP-N-acetyl-D-mannosaminuronate dehydrogenase
MKTLRNDNKINRLVNLLLEKIQVYGSSDTKVVFMGLSTYPNTGHMFNWDIVYLYKCLQKARIEARIHDPHIRGTEAISAGLWLGRRTKEESWTNAYDCLILSCPHIFYMNNIHKIGYLLKNTKPCLFLDLYGSLSRITNIGDGIDVVNFSEETKEAGIMGGLIPMNIKKRLS